MHAPWKTLAAAALAVAGLAGAAQAAQVNLITFHSYKLEHRPKVVFPGKRIHISPYPTSKRAASVWASDFCWRTCTGQAGWHYQACWRANGPEACREALDANNRFCLRTCRTRGGPLVNLAD